VSAVVRVIATVSLRPPIERRQMREHWEQNRDSFDGPPWLLEGLLDEGRDAERIELRVGLSAQDDAGRRIDAGGGFDIAGPRRGAGAIWHRYHGPTLPGETPEQRQLRYESHRVGLPDIEDAINRMLGRDPELRRPPRLAWGRLIAALAAEGIRFEEEQLIELPLTVELEDDVLADLDAT
jgi:hypothetical protein